MIPSQSAFGSKRDLALAGFVLLSTSAIVPGTASQGEAIEAAIANLKEATELYLEEFPRDTINE